jgi:hypothetical protein
VVLVIAAKETATATMEHKKSTSRKKGGFACRIHEHGKSPFKTFISLEFATKNREIHFN